MVNKLKFLKVMKLVKFGLFSNIWLFLDLFPKKSDFRQKSSNLHQFGTFECKIRPFLDLFAKNSHISDSPKKLIIWELFGKRPCFQWYFWLFQGITVYLILYPISLIISSHFREVPTFEWKSRPIPDLFPSKSQILNKSPKYSDFLGIMWRDFDSSGIFQLFKGLLTMFLYYSILQ